MNKGKKTLKVIGIILGSLIVLVIVVHTILNIVFGIQLRNKLAELKAEGRPMTIAEIVPPPVSDKDNAALFYKKAFALLETEEIKQTARIIGELKSFSDISQWTDEQIREIPKLINSRDIQYIYEILEEGSKKIKCNFNPNYEDGFNMQLPYLNSIRGAMRLICAKALIEAESGNIEEAINTLLTGLKISNHLKDEPLLISQLVRIACDGIIIKGIEDTSDSKSIPVEKANLIMNELSLHQGIEPFVKSMDGERVVWGMWAFEKIFRGKPIELKELIDNPSIPTPLLVIASFLTKPIFKKDFECYLTLMSKAQDSYNSPYYDKIDRKDEIISKYCIFTNMLLPAIGKMRENIAAYQANIVLCRIGLALKLYKAKNGTYPEKLESLVPEFLKEVSVDPFSGENLKYSRYGKGFKLYSIGPNMQNDFGTPRAKENSAPAYNDYDIVWESKN